MSGFQRKPVRLKPGVSRHWGCDLVDNYFRDFDPAIGGYIQPDPIGLAGGSYSTYAYVGDNPINGWDRFGLCDQKKKDCVPRPEVIKWICEVLATDAVQFDVDRKS